jgi:hypothetical protein
MTTVEISKSESSPKDEGRMTKREAMGAGFVIRPLVIRH